MNGAESLVRTLVEGGVEVCFANPGTSEMHFVAALDRVDGVRCVLCLFEGVVTGAADGYARMAEKPAATLLHLGPGLANGLANIHNASRAKSPMINVVGEHATYHLEHDAPLTADIEMLAKQYSPWMKTSRSSQEVAADGAAAIAAAKTAPGRIATLILPADTAWSEGGPVASVPPVPAREKVSDEAVEAVARLLESGEPVLLLLGDRAVRATPLEDASRIVNATGARMLAQTSNARMERGAGRVSIDRVPYPVDAALEKLGGFKHIVLVGAKDPVGFFGYPGKPSRLAPDDCAIHTLATIEQDQADALARLAERVARDAKPSLTAPSHPEIPRDAPLNSDSISTLLGALLPDQAIVTDESVTTGRNFFPATAGAPPHDWLQLTGGAIGVGIPLATGAAIACPERQVVALQADGSGMYTLQGLWTQAREKLNVLTCIWSNRSYAILNGELANVGAENPGPKALDMLSLRHPDLDWTKLAEGMGVPARRVETVAEFEEAFREGLAVDGPFLIEVVI
jgi:acetolactate synthase I/II/III large subunit